jgi:Protein of unknown function (DUF1648)
MKTSTNSPLFLGALALAALFIWRTSARLPAVVATHFGTAGEPNGYMTHTFYLRFMLAFVVLLPWLVNFALERILASPNARINLPNREHWLSDTQRAQTIEFLLRHMRCFGLLLAAFLCGVHWLVVSANAAVPPALDNTRFGVFLGAYLLAIVVWIIGLRRRFRRPPA